MTMLRTDTFVRQIKAGGQKHRAGRFVLTTDGDAFLWVPDQAGPKLIAYAANATLERDRTRPNYLLVAVPDQERWEMVKASCGCGSPLKRMNIRAAITSARQIHA